MPFSLFLHSDVTVKTLQITKTEIRTKITLRHFAREPVTLLNYLQNTNASSTFTARLAIQCGGHVHVVMGFEYKHLVFKGRQSPAYAAVGLLISKYLLQTSPLQDHHTTCVYCLYSECVVGKKNGTSIFDKCVFTLALNTHIGLNINQSTQYSDTVGIEFMFT